MNSNYHIAKLEDRVRELEDTSHVQQDITKYYCDKYNALREAVRAEYTAHKTTPDQNEVPSHCMCGVCTIARKFKLHEHCTESPRAVDIPHTDSASELMKRPKQERDEAMKRGAEIMKDEYEGEGSCSNNAKPSTRSSDTSTGSTHGGGRAPKKSGLADMGAHVGATRSALDCEACNGSGNLCDPTQPPGKMWSTCPVCKGTRKMEPKG